MGEYQGIAARIASVLEEAKHNGGINAGEIPDIVADCFGRGVGEINCYPGIPGAPCCDYSVFVSTRVRSPVHRGMQQRRGYLNCRDAIEKIVQHMQGFCSGRTRVVFFLTNDWNVDAFEDWKANLQQIKGVAHIEVYLMTGWTVSEINI